MFSVYVDDQFIATFPGKQEAFFRTFCSTHNICYHYSDKIRNYFLSPSLKDVNLIISTVNDNNKDLNELAERIVDRLKVHGAFVFLSSYDSLHNKIMKTLNGQILLSFAIRFTSNVSPKKKGKVRFFYSIKQKERSLQLVYFIIKHLVGHKDFFDHEITRLWDLALNFNYRKIFLSEVPSVLIELENADLAKVNYFEKAVVSGLLELHGKKPLEDQLALFIKLASSLEEEKEPLKVIDNGEKPKGSSGQEDAVGKLNQLEIKDNTGDGNTKKNYRYNRSPFLYPPGEGPIYTFAPRAREINYLNYQPHCLPGTSSIFLQNFVKNNFNEQPPPLPDIPQNKHKEEKVHRFVSPKTVCRHAKTKNIVIKGTNGTKSNLPYSP